MNTAGIDNEKELISQFTGSDIEALAGAIGGTRARDAVLRVISEISARRLGAVVFTASVCRAESMEIERIFSSDSGTYPVGAVTNKRETQWGRQVLQRRLVFIGEGPLEMAAAFDDQEAMAKAGVRSIINIPVLLNERCIGVLNFGFGGDRVSPPIIAAVRCLGLAATAGFAAHVAQQGTLGAPEPANTVLIDRFHRRAGEPLTIKSGSADLPPAPV